MSKYVLFHLYGFCFTFDRELLSERSAKLALVLKDNPQPDISPLIQDIPAVDDECLELVARFCHGFEVNITPHNVIQLSCIAHYFEMTENHYKNNLLKRALTFLEQNIIPSWTNCLRALNSAENVLQEALNLGILDTLVDSIITKALANPTLLGEPLKKSKHSSNEASRRKFIKPNTKRRLFVLDCESEDLTMLSLQIYKPVIQAMIQHKVPLEHVAASLYRYAKTRVFPGDKYLSVYEKNTRRESIQVIQSLLPHEKGLFPSKLLFQMLGVAMYLEASPECRKGFEVRIGKQLDQATVKDILVLLQGLGNEKEFDTSCLKRILEAFYQNFSGWDVSGLVIVAKLVEGFLLELARVTKLSISTFASVAEMSVAASEVTNRTSDGIYKAIDIYLDTHKDMTESEKEELCRVLDCDKMSSEACQHAVQNTRLPTRVILRVMYMLQLQLRDSQEEKQRENDVRREMEEMRRKVMELERECDVMRKEIENGRSEGSMWKEMKRKFGCISISSSSSSNMQDCNFQFKKKKVYPKQKLYI